MKLITQKRKILILDDDEEYRNSVISLFNDIDLEFLQAGTVRNALTLLDDNPDVKVIILDLQLGQIPGTALLQAMRNKKQNYRVIVLTAHEELLAAREAAAYNVFSYVTKTDKSFREALLFHINDAFSAIENAWLEKRINAHLEIVRRINLLGLRDRDAANQEVSEVLGLICDYAVDLLGAYTCHIRILDPGRGDFVLWASKGRVEEVEKIFEPRVPLNRAYSGLAAEIKDPINEGKLQEQPAFQKMKAEAFARDSAASTREYWNTVRSAYVVPISTGVFGIEIDSVFNINSDSEDFFFEKERQELVNDFVSQTALAITKQLLKKKRLDIHDDYRNIGDMLEEISNIFIAGEGELEKIYEIVFKRISAGLGPEIISIFLFDDTSQQLKNVSEYRAGILMGRMNEQYSRGSGMVGRVFAAGKTKIFARRDDPTEEAALPEGYLEEDIKNIPSGKLLHYLAVPIKFGNEPIGVIRAVNKKSEHYDLEQEKTKSICLLKRGFSDDCRTELEIAASHLAATIKNAELIGELNKTVNQLESLYAVGHLISYRKDINALLGLIVQSAAQVMRAEICMLFLKENRKDRVVLTQSFGMPLIEGAYYELGEGKTGKVAGSGELIIEEQADRNYRGKYDDEIETFLFDKHGSASTGIQSFLAVPIFTDGRIAGVIKFINKVEAPFQFDRADLNHFELFARQIGGLERFLEPQRYLESFIELSPDPIIFLDEKGQVKFFNKACEQLWGYTSDEAINRPVGEFYARPEQAKVIGKKLWKEQGHRIHSMDTLIKDRFGTIIPVRLSAAFQFDEGRRIGSFGVFKDLRGIREVEELRDKILRSEREAVVGKLAQTIGHEVKHNIGTVLNYLDALLYECDKDRQQELYQIYIDMQDSLVEAVGKLKNVLDAVRPSPPQKQLCRVKDIFTESIRGHMKRQADHKAVDFVFECSNLEHELAVDFKQIEDVLWNLFDNSMDAIAKKKSGGMLDGRGVIRVIAAIEKQNLRFTWSDNGCGIPKKNHDIIFQPMHTDKPNGTGLGLPILKNNVEGHGGHVKLESVEGEGATFVVSIPIATDLDRESYG